MYGIRKLFDAFSQSCAKASVCNQTYALNLLSYHVLNCSLRILCLIVCRIVQETLPNSRALYFFIIFLLIDCKTHFFRGLASANFWCASINYFVVTWYKVTVAELEFGRATSLVEVAGRWRRHSILKDVLVCHLCFCLIIFIFLIHIVVKACASGRLLGNQLISHSNNIHGFLRLRYLWPSLQWRSREWAIH